MTKFAMKTVQSIFVFNVPLEIGTWYLITTPVASAMYVLKEFVWRSHAQKVLLWKNLLHQKIM